MPAAGIGGLLSACSVMHSAAMVRSKKSTRITVNLRDEEHAALSTLAEQHDVSLFSDYTPGHHGILGPPRQGRSSDRVDVSCSQRGERILMQPAFAETSEFYRVDATLKLDPKRRIGAWAIHDPRPRLVVLWQASFRICLAIFGCSIQALVSAH